MLSPVSWRILIVIVIAVLALVPICSMLVPDGSPFHLSAYALTLVGKIMCYAIGALALDLVWGYCGILSLGHSLFLRAWRLHDGHVPDALDRTRRGLP